MLFTLSPPVSRRYAGIIANPEVAVKVACGKICPCTLRPWESDFPEQLDSLPSHAPRAPLKRGRRTLTSEETNNFGRTGFSRLPTDAQLGSMTVAQLREFLGVSALQRIDNGISERR